MKLWLWEYLGKVSSNYHCEGGLVVVAASEAEARALIATHASVEVTEDEWLKGMLFDLSGDPPSRIITFPDAGCC
jgi:hypothetical protein